MLTRYFNLIVNRFSSDRRNVCYSKYLENQIFSNKVQ